MTRRCPARPDAPRTDRERLLLVLFRRLDAKKQEAFIRAMRRAGR